MLIDVHRFINQHNLGGTILQLPSPQSYHLWCATRWLSTPSQVLLGPPAQAGKFETFWNGKGGRLFLEQPFFTGAKNIPKIASKTHGFSQKELPWNRMCRSRLSPKAVGEILWNRGFSGPWSCQRFFKGTYHCRNGAENHRTGNF